MTSSCLISRNTFLRWFPVITGSFHSLVITFTFPFRVKFLTQKWTTKINDQKRSVLRWDESSGFVESLLGSFHLGCIASPYSILHLVQNHSSSHLGAFLVPLWCIKYFSRLPEGSGQAAFQRESLPNCSSLRDLEIRERRNEKHLNEGLWWTLWQATKKASLPKDTSTRPLGTHLAKGFHLSVPLGVASASESHLTQVTLVLLMAPSNTDWCGVQMLVGPGQYLRAVCAQAPSRWLGWCLGPRHNTGLPPAQLLPPPLPSHRRRS